MNPRAAAEDPALAKAILSPLRALAARFEPLSPAEARLLDAAPRGEQADFKDLPADPTIRAEIIRWLCIDKAAVSLLAPAGILIDSATVTGTLDLSFARIDFPIALFRCKAPDVDLYYAQVRALNLGQSTIGRFAGAGLSVGNDLLMRAIRVSGGIDLHNGHVGGNLNLDEAVLSGPSAANGMAIWAENATIGGSVNLRAATVAGCVQFMNARIGGSFECGDSKIVAPSSEWANALWLERAKVTGHVLLRRNFTPGRRAEIEGRVNLLALEVGGNLECDGASLTNPAGLALLAEGLRVKGGVFLRAGFTAVGGVHLLLAHIDGNLDCKGATLKRETGSALAADGSNIGGVLLLGPGFASEGGVTLTAATIGVSVSCIGRFTATNGAALGLSSAVIRAQLAIGPGFESQGSVSLVAAKIGGNLSIKGAQLINHDGIALGADGATVGGSVILGPTDDEAALGGGAIDLGVRSEGVVRFHSAHIDLHFNCTESVLSCPAGDALYLQGVAIKGNLELGRGFRPVGRVDVSLANVETMLSLSGADLGASELSLLATHAGALQDEPSSWPPRGKLILDGFTYDRLLSPPFDAEGRLAWLRRQLPDTAGGDKLRLQPYRQIAKILDAQGYDDDATDVLIGLQDDRRRHGGLSWPARFGLVLLKLTTGYGYAPARTLWYIAGFIVAGYLIFGAAWQAGEIVPTAGDALASYRKQAPPASYESFCALTYATDVFVPIIDLGQRSQWHPVASARDAMTPVSSPGGWLCEGLPIHAAWLAPPIWLVRLFRWTDIVAGWLLSSLLVAAVGGLVRKS